MSVERIEFSLAPVWGPHFENFFPPPYPASKEIPEWFKSLPATVEAGGKPTQTVKNCPPFLEALSCGYILPVGTDIRITLEASGMLRYESKTAAIVDAHPSAQVAGSPFEGFPIVKIGNPWLIRTPPGYSTLFIPLLNRFGMPIVPLAGLVETDLFYREVNFPSVVTLRRGGSLILPQGTPLVQMIPFRRDEFQLERTPADEQKYNDTVWYTTRSEPEHQHYYKNNSWRKKNYR